MVAKLVIITQKEAAAANLQYRPGISLQGMIKTMKNFHVRAPGLWGEKGSRDLPHTKQESCLVYRDVRSNSERILPHLASFLASQVSHSMCLGTEMRENPTPDLTNSYVSSM
jgi:hypothetical protein